jgi:chromosome segregation ATPase
LIDGRVQADRTIQTITLTQQYDDHWYRIEDIDEQWSTCIVEFNEQKEQFHTVQHAINELDQQLNEFDERIEHCHVISELRDTLENKRSEQEQIQVSRTPTMLIAKRMLSVRFR